VAAAPEKACMFWVLDWSYALNVGKNAIGRTAKPNLYNTRACARHSRARMPLLRPKRATRGPRA